MIKQLSFLATLTSVLILSSCNVGTSGMWKNDSIDASVRSEIKQLDDKLIAAVKTHNITGVKALLSDKLLENSAELADLINQVSPVLVNTDYRILDEYLVKNTTTGLSNTLPSGLSGDDDYVISYLALNKEMYVSLFIPYNPTSELMVTAIYGKYGSEWKINILYFGKYSIGGNTAPEFYKMAKEMHQKSSLMDAANCMYLASLCSNPSSAWKYRKGDEIKSFGEKVIAEAESKYKFPFYLSKIESKPQIIGMLPDMKNHKLLPIITYISSISLKDSVALRVENLKIRKDIESFFPGINQNKEYIAYRAFNEKPDGVKKTPYYGFVDTLSVK